VKSVGMKFGNDQIFEEVVKSAQNAAVLILVYGTTKKRRNKVLPALLLCYLVVNTKPGAHGVTRPTFLESA
jgi:hypothetical protein